MLEVVLNQLDGSVHQVFHQLMALEISLVEGKVAMSSKV